LLQKPAFLFTGEIAPKRQMKNEKCQKGSDFGFSHQEVRKKIVKKNGQIYLLSGIFTNFGHHII
jgi:hypothetical protein